jgi:hypothetical protein
MSKEAMLVAEVTVLTEMVRVLSDKLAIEQNKQEQGEPVAWTIDSLEQEIYENTREFVSLNVMELLLNRLNTTPQQRKWVGLTEEERDEIYLAVELGANGEELIEAKLKDKNNA